MRPKGKLFALLAVFMAIGVVAATGAFTSVSAERTATVSVANDSNALLGLEPHTGPNGAGAYASNTSGQLAIDLSGGNSGGLSSASGVNQNATTRINNVFNVSNNGAQNIEFHIEVTGGSINDSAATELVTFYNGTTSGTNITFPSGASPTSDSKAMVPAGQQTTISIKVDTTQDALNNAGLSELNNSVEIISDITIVANGTSTN